MPYYDADGNECTLPVMCTREPGWAANRLQHTQSELSALRADAEQLRVQLAGCLCAAEGLFAERAVKGDYGWSLPYETMTQVHQELSALRARVAELEAQVQQDAEDEMALHVRLLEATQRLATLEAPPVVPYGFDVVNRYDGVGWCLAAKVVEMGTQETAQAYRALAWAMAHNSRPPHAADEKEGKS
jgi:hypothetical protein